MIYATFNPKQPVSPLFSPHHETTRPLTWLQTPAAAGADALNDNYQLVEHGLARSMSSATSAITS